MSYNHLKEFNYEHENSFTTSNESSAPIVHYRYINMNGQTVDEYYDNGFKFYKLRKNQIPLFTMIVYVDRNNNQLSAKSMDWTGTII